MTTNSIEKETISALSAFNIKNCTFNLKNKIATFYIQTDRVDRPNAEIYAVIEKLPFFHCFTVKRFNIGKAITGVSNYHISFSVKKEYYDGKIDTTKGQGQFLQYVYDNNITTVRELMNHTIDMIRNLNQFCHVTKDKEYKRALYSTKKSYIKFLYNHTLIDSIEYQYNIQPGFKNPDKLYLFKIGDLSFHLRSVNVDFLWGNRHYDIKLNNMLYQPKESYSVNSMEFEKHLWLLSNLNNSQLIANAELKTENPLWHSMY